MKISIQVNESEKKYIKKQESLDFGEKNTFMKLIDTTESLKNFELKSVQLMVNGKVNKKSSTFNNGLLIYHRNRLIKRFDCEFGDLLTCLELMDKPTYGYFQICGRIQVPDSL